MGEFSFVFTGESGSGKTTLARMLEDIMQVDYDVSCQVRSFAGPIKEKAKEIYGPNPTRAQLQELGDRLRVEQPGCVIEWAKEALSRCSDKFASFDDARRTEELAFGKVHGVLILVDTNLEERRARRLKRDGKQISSNEENHTTEQQVRSLKPDYIIDNDGTTEDARRQLIKIVMTVMSGGHSDEGIHTDRRNSGNNSTGDNSNNS